MTSNNDVDTVEVVRRRRLVYFGHVVQSAWDMIVICIYFYFYLFIMKFVLKVQYKKYSSIHHKKIQ